MSKSTLSQVLNAFEHNQGPVTMAQIARQLELSPARLEGMIQYWVRKGKLRRVNQYKECGSCGHGADSCPFVVELPRSYELVTPDSLTIPLAAAASCGHKGK
jgi:hypothetical protein